MYSAIHVEVEKLEEIAKKYQINVIYDAAHAFDLHGRTSQFW